MSIQSLQAKINALQSVIASTSASIGLITNRENYFQTLGSLETMGEQMFSLQEQHAVIITGDESSIIFSMRIGNQLFIEIGDEIYSVQDAGGLVKLNAKSLETTFEYSDNKESVKHLNDYLTDNHAYNITDYGDEWPTDEMKIVKSTRHFKGYGFKKNGNMYMFYKGGVIKV